MVRSSRAPKRDKARRRAYGGGNHSNHWTHSPTVRIHEREVLAAIQESHYKEERKTYSKAAAALRESALARSVFVDYVRTDNLPLIQSYFETHHGPVEYCNLAKNRPGKHQQQQQRRGGGNPFYEKPPAVRLRFVNVSDAQKVLALHGSPVPPEIWRRPGNTFRVLRSFPYKDMVPNAPETCVIEFSASRLALGHYFPNNNNIEAELGQQQGDWQYDDTMEEEEEFAFEANDRNTTKEEDWLEERHTDERLKVRFNLAQQTIELEIGKRTPEYEIPQTTRGEEKPAQERPAVSSGWSLYEMFFDPQNLTGNRILILDPILRDMIGGRIFKAHIAVVRFKELHGFVDFVRDGNENHQYCLIFSLKHPPKLFSEYDVADPDGEPERERGLSFGKLTAGMFGGCFGMKLNVSKSSLVNLLSHKKLKSFGILRSELHSVYEARILRCKHIGSKGCPTEKATMMEFEKLHKMDSTIGTYVLSLSFFSQAPSYSQSFMLRSSSKVCYGSGQVLLVRRLPRYNCAKRNRGTSQFVLFVIFLHIDWFLLWGGSSTYSTL